MEITTPGGPLIVKENNFAWCGRERQAAHTFRNLSDPDEKILSSQIMRGSASIRFCAWCDTLEGNFGTGDKASKSGEIDPGRLRMVQCFQTRKMCKETWATTGKV
jgi:hypothetical protein